MSDDESPDSFLSEQGETSHQLDSPPEVLTASPPLPPQSAEGMLRGTVLRVTFRNPENGYTVLQVQPQAELAPVTVVGHALDAREGSVVIARGQFTTHKKFGVQFQARSISESPPTTPDELTRYLASGVIKGIGPKSAARIIKEFGAHTLEIARSDPRRVGKVAGIGRKKAELLAAALSRREDRDEVLQFCIEHHITAALAHKIFKFYGARAVEILTRDPYLLARDLKGIGFTTADGIARNLGIRQDAPQRLRAGLMYALEKAADDGHTFLPDRLLAERARALLELGDEISLEQPLADLIADKQLTRTVRGLYLPDLYVAEGRVAKFVAERIGANVDPRAGTGSLEVGAAMVQRDFPADLTTELCAAEQKLGLSFSPEQRHAVALAVRNRLLLITGGPGCGKTTVIRALCAVFRKGEARLMLTAPTGRAAQRIAQVAGLPASTIHRLLKYDPSRRAFTYGANDKLPVDVLIVDEASMVDIELARDLVDAIPAEATLILVGDKDQLPSVGPGRVFAELLTVPNIAVVSLTQLFRRGEASAITSVAHSINTGISPRIPEPDGVTKSDAYFLSRSDAEEAASMIEKLVGDQIPKKFGIPVQDITVLTPTNRGPLGTLLLNQRLQERLNPRSRSLSAEEITLPGFTLRVGDRVCQRVNNYQLDPLGVFNGDLGYVQTIDPLLGRATVELWDGRLVKYEKEALYELSLAYAITVHRSQGSEMPCVVLALHDSHFTLLERQLVYTGVTRAKKLLVVVGSRRALEIAAKRTKSIKRNATLAERTVFLVESLARPA